MLNTTACTMPTAERPFRLAEFDVLFAEHVRDVERDGDLLRMRMSGEAGLRARVADLTTRESDCCSFFDFKITGSDQDLVLEVGVPPARREILDSLAERAVQRSD